LTTPIMVVFSRSWDKSSSFIVSSRERRARGLKVPWPSLIAEMVAAWGSKSMRLNGPDPEI